MDRKIFALAALSLLTIGCAQKGVVVEKRLKPSPFFYSAGIEGVYSFLLRDDHGNVHSQMVTPDVFNRYEVGDYFDDQQSGPARRETGFNKESGFSKEGEISDSKDVRPVHHAAPHKRHRTTSTTHHKAHRSLRANVKPREDENAPQENPETPSTGLMLRKPNPEPQGLDVHP